MVSYKVKVKSDGKRGDDILSDFVVAAGAAPPAECEPGNLLCTENPVPAIEARKSADPEPGTEVEAGQVLSYTLRFTNTGAAPAAVGFADVIKGVLDDATLVGRPASSDPRVTVSAVTAGRLTVSGTVNPGRTVTVSYRVRVKPNGERGDDLLAGFLIKTGDEPPSECTTATARCTAHQVGGST
jgi:hypothetical protein